MTDPHPDEEHIGPCPLGPRSGRTEWMLTHLFAAVMDGQPRTVVLGVNHHHADYLFKRFLDSYFEVLKSDGSVVVNRSIRQIEIDCGVQIVRFTSLDFWGRDRSGRSDWAVFEDHWTAGEE